MKTFLTSVFLSVILTLIISAANPPAKSIHVLVITGGHDYKFEQFNNMLSSLGENIKCQIAELPGAYNMFLPENRNKYDVLVFYHMWQHITEKQAAILSDCIRQGKPLVVLHHSICAYDDWPEYFNIIGGKYFHKLTTVNGKEYAACSYVEDVHFIVKVVDHGNPVTKGIKDFEIFDEIYKGYYVEDGVTPLVTTDEPGSNPVIGWTKHYGKARVVTLQSGHDVPAFENPNFRKLLKQSIEWVCKVGK
ncbi:MAG: ThuA domain-containing protein [Bacteroidetes bacterium]|nr:MAG: ThuA domain-containing protein [Bacteroidota bacterium]